MTAPTRDAIAAEAVAWAVAKRDHWALVQATYRDTGLPSKRDYSAVMAAGERMDDLARRLYEMALAEAGEREAVVVGEQMAMLMEVR